MKWQEIWETPKWHSKVHIFVLGEIFTKLFYVVTLSRSKQKRLTSDFQVETQHNNSHYGCNKGRQVKKEKGKKGEKRCLLSSCLHKCQHHDPSKLLCGCHHGGLQHHGETAQQRPPCPPPRPRILAPAAQDNLHCWLPPPLLQNTEQSQCNNNKSHSPCYINKILLFSLLLWEGHVWNCDREGPGHTEGWNLKDVNPTSTSCPSTPAWRNHVASLPLSAVLIFRSGLFLLFVPSVEPTGLPIHGGSSSSSSSKNSNYNYIKRLGCSQNKIPFHTFLFRCDP